MGIRRSSWLVVRLGVAVWLAGALLLAASPAPVSAAGGDWAQFRGDPAQTGYNSHETTISVSNVAGLNVAWKGVIGVDAQNMEASSSPAVADGVVYIGSNNGRLSAFKVGCATGGGTCTPIWTATAGDHIDSSPAVAKGVVYVGSMDGKLYAFAVGCASGGGTCLPLWTGDTGQGIEGSPTVANGVVYVGSDSGALYAFDAAGGNAYCDGTSLSRTCKPLWKTATYALGPVRSSPAVVDGVVYVGDDAGHLHALDAAGGDAYCEGSFPSKTCSPLWTGATPGPYIGDAPAVAGGVVYVGSAGGLYAFDAAGPAAYCQGSFPSRSCTPLWHGTMGSVGESSPAVANGVIYVGSVADGMLYAFKAGCASHGASCNPLWTGATSVGATPQHVGISSSSAVANGVVYVGSLDGKLYAFDAAGVASCTSGSPAHCTPLWTGPVGGSVWSSPAVANGVVYIGSDNGKLYAFDLRSGPPPTRTPGASAAASTVASASSTSEATATGPGGVPGGSTSAGASATSTSSPGPGGAGTSSESGPPLPLIILAGLVVLGLLGGGAAIALHFASINNYGINDEGIKSARPSGGGVTPVGPGGGGSGGLTTSGGTKNVTIKGSTNMNGQVGIASTGPMSVGPSRGGTTPVGPGSSPGGGGGQQVASAGEPVPGAEVYIELEPDNQP